MKASYITKYGGIGELKFGEIPNPVLTDDKILVNVKAVSINPIDYKFRSGALKIITGNKFPKIYGGDFSGIVQEIGNKVENFKKEDRVYGSISIFKNNGALCEQVLVSPNKIRKIPDNMSFEVAASLPIAALTALTGMRKSGNLNNKTILVNGATGGVGHFAVQFAKAYGAKVYATCSTKNAELAKQFGADEIIDYTKEDLSKSEKKFDIIFDAFGLMKTGIIFKLLNKRGIYMSTIFFSPISFLSGFYAKIFLNKKLTSANMRGNIEDYQELERLWNENKFKPFIEKTFPLENTKEAFDFAENGKPRGKVIVTIEIL